MEISKHEVVYFPSEKLSENTPTITDNLSRNRGSPYLPFSIQRTIKK